MVCVQQAAVTLYSNYIRLRERDVTSLPNSYFPQAMNARCLLSHRTQEILKLTEWYGLEIKCEMITCPVFKQQQQQIKILQTGVHKKKDIKDDR